MNVIRPLAFLMPEAGLKIAFIILNHHTDFHLIKHLWKKSVFTAVVDGAVNHLHSSISQEQYLPSIITGDFDSADPDLLEYYKNHKVPVVATPDQDETDFTKCLRIVVDKMGTCSQILAVGAFGGRMDHTFANVNTLYTALKLTKIPVLLVADNSMSVLLDKGEHTLHCDTGYEGDWCGLIPIGQPADHVTTTGLKYNLTNDRMNFGDLISTSNSLAGSVVTVTTDQPLLWVMGFTDLKGN
ncbi:thiamine pyrophosphokinase 1-like isoform X2 [Biomphalaria pfeifferi]|uniref:Thiamine pyrophosphokinase n=1 Tax=Biomphalaria pfeifferi TaxID=112525 RepID=A0AAD8B9Y9_BIOPF|nr:thiamine pyrophosphokinase 1-like isoform X2 [Biomphalaria pfeifferi]